MYTSSASAARSRHGLGLKRPGGPHLGVRRALAGLGDACLKAWASSLEGRRRAPCRPPWRSIWTRAAQSRQREVRPAQEKLQNEQQIGAGMREMPTLCWVWAQRIAAGNAGLASGQRGVDLPKQLGASCTHPRIPMCRPGAALSCEKALACLSQDRPTPAAVQMGGEGMRD